MNITSETIGSFVTSLGIYPLFAFILVAGLYIFWRETRFSKKNRNSVFDMYFFSVILSAIWGRTSYIIANFVEFANLPWFLFPYERYADGFYIFRLLPWRYFRVWDGGFLFTGIFVSLIVGGFLYATVIKKWRWRDMMGPVYSSAISMLAMTLYFYGFFTYTNLIISQGLRLMFISGLYFLITMILVRFKERLGALYTRVVPVSLLLFVIASSWFISRIFIGTGSTYVDELNIYAYLATTVLASLYYIYDSLRVELNIETITNIKAPISIMTNHPVKVKGREGDDKR